MVTTTTDQVDIRVQPTRPAHALPKDRLLVVHFLVSSPFIVLVLSDR